MWTAVTDQPEHCGIGASFSVFHHLPVNFFYTRNRLWLPLLSVGKRIISNQNLSWLCALPGKKILVIHDIAPIIKDPKNYFRWFLYFGAKYANKIVTVSEATKQEIVNVLGISESKITVIPNFTTFHYIELPRNGVLVIGNKFKDNSRIYDKVGDVIRVGSMCENERKYFVGKHIKFVPRYEMNELMCSVKAYISDSAHESFGIPLLEAAACHTPIICEHHPGIPELMCAKLDEIDNVLNDKEYRSRMVRHNLEVSKNYTLKNVVERWQKIL